MWSAHLTQLSHQVYHNIRLASIPISPHCMATSYTSSLGMNLILISKVCPGRSIPEGGSTSKYLGGGFSFIFLRKCIGMCRGSFLGGLSVMAAQSHLNRGLCADQIIPSGDHEGNRHWRWGEGSRHWRWGEGVGVRGERNRVLEVRGLGDRTPHPSQYKEQLPYPPPSILIQSIPSSLHEMYMHMYK